MQIHFDPTIQIGTIITVASVVISLTILFTTQKTHLNTIFLKMDQLHKDLRELIGQVNKHETRISVIEDREGRDR